jgi:2-keto-4-pentenoate hydratase/2-oxohepta-3-ene-1,7-dioic acid hydratase in catechol pathway
VVSGDEVIDLNAALGIGLHDVAAFLAWGAEGRAQAERCLRSAAPRLPLSSVELRSPIVQADKILGVGMNYHSFVAAVRRAGMNIPTQRIWFQRPRSCIVGPHDDVWLPRDANDLDYEAELAVIIGRRCRRVSSSEAPSVVAGFTVANDLTLRERVARSPVLGKSFDTHTPLGPWIVTSDEIGDPHGLTMRTWVNAELRQQANTADMISDCYELIAEISAVCTLNPGDIILTGTPEGCGAFHRPPLALTTGDIVKIEIEGIGVIENRVVVEPLVA